MEKLMYFVTLVEVML